MRCKSSFHARVLLCLLLLTSTSQVVSGESVPAQNQAKGTRPEFGNTDLMARKILAAINANDVKIADGVFFPEEPFLALKDIPDAKQYYGKLIQWFYDDLHKQYLTLKSPEKLEFVSFKPGFCKWKQVGSEYNKIPYWSCYRSTITAKAGETTKTIPVKVMINWGPEWFVTHLGR